MSLSKVLIALTLAALAAVAVFPRLDYPMLHAAEGSPEPGEVVEPADSPFAVVELFTSEGCSSCPPADRLLVELSERSRRPGSRLYPLVFHVDYWNDLGWPDPFADEQWSERQRRYAAGWKTSRVYTPQAVVNGRDAFVGSRRGRMATATQQALERPAEARLELQAFRHGEAIRVQFLASGRLSRAVLQVALVQDSATTEVAAGENRGRTLHHANVVRALETVDLHSTGEGYIDLVPPAGLALSAARVVAFVQDAASMAIRGAASSRVRQGS